ncbi:MAG: alpha/beta fold hydrolase [Candidatus Jordarchaeaceae archaeon]
MALAVIGLMLTATAVSMTSTLANSSSVILPNLIGSIYTSTTNSNSASSPESTLLVKSYDGWNLTVDGRGFSFYTNLREYVWTTSRPPYGPYDKIALHRLVDPNVKSKGVIFICPGTYSNGEQLLSNPPGSLFNVSENYSIAPYLANRGFDVYSIDYRTHFVPPTMNKSELSFMANWGWDQWISDIKAAIDLTKKVSGADKIYLAGESFGGIAAMNYASLYWKTDLKGIILLDGGIGGKNSSLVTNTFNLTQALQIMYATWNGASETFGIPGGVFLMQYAAANPSAPAPENATPAINPRTGLPWANVTEYCAFLVYYSTYPILGGLSNIYGGYADPDVVVRVFSLFDRWWPNRLSLETNAITNWNNSPFVTYDFDDHYIEIDVPLLGFLSGNLGVILFGPFIHGIANPDFTGRILPGYGHFDVYAGEYSEKDVNAPTYEWLISHRMLIGFGMIRNNKCWTPTEITIFINATTIDLKTDDIRVPWNIIFHKSLKNLEIYKGSGELGNLNIIIYHKELAMATGSGVLFLGKMV